MFSAATPSIEARTVMGAPGGSTGSVEGPVSMEDQVFLTGTLCDSLTLCPKDGREGNSYADQKECLHFQMNEGWMKFGGTQFESLRRYC